MKEYRAGIDIGSTTVKLVILDEEDRILYGEYKRHMARTQQTLADMLKEAKAVVGDAMLRTQITGSGSINLGRAMGIGFVQEVVAVASALKHSHPQTDVAIELGGEDAKIIYFNGGLDERMNGVCAGGTGSFIDQMAALLQTDAAGLNAEAAHYENIYPIAARCGVFAKTDIQPLINEGASKADLAASIFQAVVNQTISGLACGKPIRGCVAFLGGPLHFLPELKKAFIRTLNLTPENVVDPQNAHLFAAMGAALGAEGVEALRIDHMIDQLSRGVTMDFEIKRLDPLFADQSEYDAFTERHGRAVVGRAELATYSGDCFLGIDAGSTTTKLALIGQQGELLFSFYANNQGNPIGTAMNAIRMLKDAMPSTARVARSCSTGYGEALLKSAFCLDEGEVETVAHCTAASFFDPQVDCVLDIGGQDMKCIRLKNGVVDNVLLNEACSSGCGSFIENFATSLGYIAPDFAREALFAENPVDLGTRCTVFMNSNVKQAQKEGATVSDISAGLAYSVIKNAIFKVIKLADASDLGQHIVVQGGTFHNRAVLRAFEKIAGVEAVCPDISGIMGAFGAALLARNHYTGQETTTLSFDDILALTYTSTATRCKGCSNHCMLTINRFPGGRRHITGNRCEKGLGGEGKQEDVPNLFAYKRKRMFDYETPTAEQAPRGTIGIPRVLNIYENYPFWATFFGRLGFHIVLSPLSDRKLYERGMESIPSESECYPAKLSHGHVQWLIDQGVKTIFHPCVYYEHKEYETTQNCYNCPIVVSYPENLKNNVEAIADGDVHYVRPFMAFRSEKVATDRLVDVCREEWGIPEKEVRRAAHAAWVEQQRAKADVRAAGAAALAWMEKNGKNGIVIAGRPYHLDPEINHGIPEMVTTFGLAVLTEDSLPIDFMPTRPIRVLDQWVYHSRLYAAAEFVRTRDDLELLQLNSFGCGLDAVTTDQVAQILEGSNKLYTVLKIDEVNNLGAARIRLRSLLAAMKMRREQHICAIPKSVEYKRTHFTKKMKKEGYTLIAPQMSKIHFDILEPVFHKYGYNVVILTNTNRAAIDVGLKYVNNDACYPSILTIGQIMDTVLSGKYDTNRLAILMSQTGGCCRASNYVGFIRNALDKLGLSHIPVISVNAAGLEKNEGFTLTPAMLVDAVHALVYGDLFMRCVYRVRPYEAVPGSANALHAKWQTICIDSLVNPKSKYKFKDVCRGIVEEFDKLPIREDVKKPRVGIVGEILVKYMPLANNHLVELLEREGAEAFVPDMMDFFCYYLFNRDYKHRYLGNSFKSAFFCKLALKVIRRVRQPAVDALKASRRFEAPMPIEQVAEMTKPVLSLGNQYGEGWFLAGEMIELITEKIPNIVCIQPFACLPNHVVGKGVIKQLKKLYPQANIAAVDYDPGASEVNQLNRIKLMLSTARENMREDS
ncbi:MAG: 2-hydroxyacyl-CoA dehydratase [Clostridia bacterium]|nr:2-hydroxyacyl-CoA dehydratase [Clostridia bacterium]